MWRYARAVLALTQPDPGVLRKAQRGDERAFTLIVRAYERPVFNYVLRLVGDRSLAEDLTQEIFIRVYQGLPGFSLRSRFTTWLFQVTKNRVLDELRALERRPRSVATLEDIPPLEADGVSPHTAHTTNPVPLVLTDGSGELREGGELRDLAPTVLDLLGIPQPPEMTGRSLLG